MTDDASAPAEIITSAHVEKETLVVDVNIPKHGARVTTPLFRRTRQELIDKHGDRCWICGLTPAETGHPTEAHHYPVERSLAELYDWARFAKDARAGMWGPTVQAFDWDHFDAAHWEVFVDDMTANGMLLCKPHHIGVDEGIHTMPHPLWVSQRYAKEGYKFNSIEVIHHGQE